MYPTIQVRNTILQLQTYHGYAGELVSSLGYGITVWSFGGIFYKVRGDGTIL